MVNWSLAQQPNAFDRAFESGFQRGEYRRQRGEQETQRNALAGYATNPNDQTFNALAQAAPEYAMQVRGQRDQQAQEQRQSAQHGIEQFRPILTQAMQGPEQWAMARRAAAQAGMDISDVPEQFDPQWAQGQMMILDAADDGSLPSIVQELQAAGINVETPEGQQVLRSALEGKYATEYVDPQGNTRRQSLFNLPDVGGQQAIQNAPQQSGGFAIQLQDFSRHVASWGPERAAAYTNDNNIPVRISDNDADYNSLPSGTLFLAPDGTTRRKP